MSLKGGINDLNIVCNFRNDLRMDDLLFQLCHISVVDLFSNDVIESRFGSLFFVHALYGMIIGDILLATDPDADRLGVYAKDAKTGEYVSFTGNMSGMLIAEYILRERFAQHHHSHYRVFVTGMGSGKASVAFL